MNRINKRTERFLIVWFLIVFTIPLARISLGSLPIYLIDIITLIGLLYRKPILKNNVFTLLIGVFGLFSLISAFYEAFYFSAFLEPTYMVFRYSLAIFSFFIISTYLDSPIYLPTLYKVFIIVLLFNGLLAILYSLPQTGDYIEKFVFGNSFLFPKRSTLVADLETTREEGFRAIGLVGGSNILAFVLLLGIGFSIYIIQLKNQLSFKWNALNFLALPIGILGLIFTYSRQAYIGLGLMLLIIVWSGKNRQIKLATFFILIIIGFFFAKINFADKAYQFTRITESIEKVEGSRKIERGDEARILAYQLPFKLLVDEPSFLFRGRGVANEKIKAYNDSNTIELIYNFSASESHALIASAIFDRGAIAAIAIITLIIIIGKEALFANSNYYLGLATLRRNMFIALVPGILFAHFFIDSRQGAYMLFIVLGLIYALNRWERTRVFNLADG